MDTALVTAVATVLNVSPNQILKITAVKLRNVYSVSFRVAAGVVAATFVSGRKVAALMPIEWHLTVGRRQRNAWVARIVGKCDRYTFKRDFLESTHIEWGRKGMESADFAISDPGYYQDSDQEYFQVIRTDAGLEYRMCSYDEVRHVFYRPVVPVVELAIA